MENQCEYCLLILKNKYNLKKHIDESKKCLKLRKNGLKCTSCSHVCKTDTELKDHLLTCKDHIINELKKTHKQEINKLKETHKQEINELKESHKQEINELKESNKQEINELKETINKLEQKIDSYVKESLSRSTVTNNHINIRNHLSMEYTLEDIKEEDLLSIVKKNLTRQVFMDGHKGLAKLCTEKIINTKDNKKLICCTDVSRKKFKYMDKSGNVKEDIDGRMFVDKVSKPIKDVGKVVYDDIIGDMREEQNQTEDYNKRDHLIFQSFQVMNRYKDIININDDRYNNIFMNELAILNK
jgi:F0F1-type ATP synthase membrane subunit b/b'